MFNPLINLVGQLPSLPVDQLRLPHSLRSLAMTKEDGFPLSRENDRGEIEIATLTQAMTENISLPP